MIRLVLVVLFLLIFFIISIPILLVELIIRKISKTASDKSSKAIVSFALRVVAFLSGTKVEVNGLENIPENEACLFIANHLGFFDIVTTYPYMKNITGYIAKKEIEKVPFLSWWMKFINCIFLDRENPREGLKSVLKAIDYINSGLSIFLFPEGTRSKDGKLHEFKDGGFKIATKSGAPIIPVGIIGTDDVLENHFPLIKATKVTISFGKPIRCSEMDRKAQKEIPAIARAEVAKLSKQEAL